MSSDLRLIFNLFFADQNEVVTNQIYASSDGLGKH